MKIPERVVHHLDALLAGAIAVLFAFEIAVEADLRGDRALAAVVSALICVTLPARQRWPLIPLVACLVGEAAGGVEAVRLARELMPDVIVMDVRMPDLEGIQATRQIVLDPASPRVLVLTTFDADEYVYEALRAGACGFLLKDGPEDQLLAAIRITAVGGSLFASAVTARLIEGFVSPGAVSALPVALTDLTGREREVLVLIARGLSNAELATSLVLSEHTAKSHVSAILRKLGLRDRLQAVILAYECGLVRPGGDA